MTYKVRVRPRDVEIEFEVGSIGEAVGVLESEKNAIGALFAAAPWAGDQAQSTTLTAPEAEAPAKGKRGPKPKNQPDPATASAPPPIPVTAPAAPLAPPPPPMPPAAAPPIAPAAPPVPGADMGIPAFLKREAPPAPPVPPVGGRLGGLVKAELEKRAPDEASKSQVAAYLVQKGMVLEGATFAEALACVSVEKDDSAELQEVAKDLGIS